MNSQQKISEINAWWNNEGKSAIKKVEEATKRKEEQQSIAQSIRSRTAGYNPLRFLKNAWDRAVIAPAHDQKAEDEAKFIAQQHAHLRDTAYSNADDLTLLASQSNERLSDDIAAINRKQDAFTKVRNTLEDMAQETRTVLDIIAKAIYETKDAQSWETIDMFGSNAFTTLLSHGETKEAIEHINRASSAINNYQTNIQQKGKSISTGDVSTVEIESIAEWDLWMGVFDLDIFSFFTSWDNHQKLEDAKGKLEAVEQQIRSIATKIDSAITGNEAEMREQFEAYKDLRDGVVSATNGLHPKMVHYSKQAPDPYRNDVPKISTSSSKRSPRML